MHAKKNLLNTQAVLGYFEKTINNKDSIQVVSPDNGTIKNVNISFGNINQQGGGRSSGNVASSTTSMTCESTIYTTILYEWHDYSYSYEGDGAWVAIAVYSETVISCYDSDSGDYDPYGGGTGGSGNYYDPYGGGTNNWWDYGTGYPYGGGSADPNSPYYDPYNDPNNPYYDPNNYTDWYPWWTGGGSGDIVLEIIPDPFVLGDFIDDPNYFEEDYMPIIFNSHQDPWPTISNVIPLSQFVEYDERNCLVLAKEQISKLGLRDLGYGSTFKIFDSQGGPYPTISKAGVDYIISKLQNGKATIVGVDNRPGTPSSVNADGKTDHFVTIVGSGSDSQGKYFTFYDNATNLSSKGASTINKLYYNEITGLITGKSAANPSFQPYYDYIVTQIRKNK